jgi:hypothetical protein
VRDAPGPCLRPGASWNVVTFQFGRIPCHGEMVAGRDRISPDNRGNVCWNALWIYPPKRHD